MALLDDAKSARRAARKVALAQDRYEAFEKSIIDKRSVANLSTGDLAKFCKLVEAEVSPIIRQMLAQNYEASGLKKVTGTLYRNTVTSAEIRLGRNGFYARMTPRLSKNDYQVAAAHRYGAVHGSKAFSAGLKVKIKRAGSSTGTRIENPKPLFFQLTEPQKKLVREMFVSKLNERIRKKVDSAFFKNLLRFRVLGG